MNGVNHLRRGVLQAGALLLVLAATAPEARAQAPYETAAQPAPAAARPTTRDTRRLFQRFAEDAAIVPAGWAEGQFVYTNLSDSGTHQFLGAQLAFRLTDQAEAGLRLGWENLDASDAPDGSGLADIDLYGKYRFHGGAGHCAIGGLVKAPTADEDKGLGTGSADVEVFGACRADLKAASATANAGARYNGSTDAPLPDSQASVLLGGGLLIPTGQRATIVIEATYESQRFDGAGSDARLTLGMQWSPPAPGLGFRGAVALPLSDAAPDSQVLFGAVWLY
jgi:hypothetical protein